MPEPIEVGELNGPTDVRHAPCYLSIDEIAKSANTHYVRTGNGQFIGDWQELLPQYPAEQPNTHDRAKENAVCGHSTDPEGSHMPKVVTVKRPFVEEDLDESTTQKYT